MRLLRVYDAGVDEFGKDGYPVEWHATVKHLVRELAGHRCERCLHPYRVGGEETPEWTPCDELCRHGGPWRTESDDYQGTGGPRTWREAQWRVLTVHHLNGVKRDCRWWNLVALCQRCHLTIQGKVVMDRAFVARHSDWFQPYAAAWYALKYLGLELTREETMARLDELLALEQRQDPLFA